MAASCRNLTISSSGDSGFNVLMATSTGPSGECHTPLLTHPNCPEPSLAVVLQKNMMTVKCSCSGHCGRTSECIEFINNCQHQLSYSTVGYDCTWANERWLEKVSIFYGTNVRHIHIKLNSQLYYMIVQSREAGSIITTSTAKNWVLSPDCLMVIYRQYLSKKSFVHSQILLPGIMGVVDDQKYLGKTIMKLLIINCAYLQH